LSLAEGNRIRVQNPAPARFNLKDLERNRCRDKEMTIALRRHDIP
jgi:hypothetical protein